MNSLFPLAFKPCHHLTPYQYHLGQKIPKEVIRKNDTYEKQFCCVIGQKERMTVGDIKQGIQTIDHNGWFILDGRLKNTLTPLQQKLASDLGIGDNLPNATGVVLMQNNEPISVVSGSNIVTISQSDLPDISFTGVTDSSGNHAHTGNTDSGGTHTHTFTQQSHPQPRMQPNAGGTYVSGANPGLVTKNTGSGGSHSHSINLVSDGEHSHSIDMGSINGGVPQTGIDITPRSLSVNHFIYLGPH